MMEFEIPQGLTGMLEEFTVAVLREKPTDLVKFACDYFNNLNENRSSPKISFQRGVAFADGSADEQMNSDYSDDEPMEPPRRPLNRRKSVSAERYDPEADEDDGDTKVIHPKSDEQRQRLTEAVRDILLFRSLEAEQMQDVIDSMYERKVEPKERVIEQGADGDNFYVIESGTYDIYVTINEGDPPKCVGSYDNKGSFGELALMYNQPRAATIEATSDGNLWAMDRVTFRRIILKNAFNKRKVYESLLENVPLLKHLEEYERQNVADALVSKRFSDGELIIKQGDSADCMYFVEDGEVKIAAKKSNHEHENEVEVARCKKGAYFGELALLTQKPRAASAYAAGDCKVAVLDVQAFERLLGNCMDIMKRNINDYEDQLAACFGSKTNISDLR